MRLVDVLFRHGHLSEGALTRAVLDGNHPAHLDQCDLCARRALDLGRWLDEVRATAAEVADEAFPAERLVVQRSQILRRLAQIDEPSRVITFPAAAATPPRDTRARRVAPAWVGVAAAAGLVVGVVGGQIAARLEHASETPRREAVVPISTPQVQAQPAASESSPANTPGSLLEMDLENFTLDSLRGIDDITPRVVPSSYIVAQR